MHIRFLAYFYAPCVGGGEVILQHQAEGLVRRGHTVDVHVTPFTNIALTEAMAPGVEVLNGVRVHRHPSVLLPFRNPLEKDALTPAFAAASQAPCDLLVCVGYPSLHLDLAVLRHARGTPLVVQNYVTADFLKEILAGEGGLHKKVRSRYWRHVVRRELGAADLVLADSPSATRALEDELRLDNVRTHIGMAVDPAEFAALGPEDEAQARLAVGAGKDRIVLAPSRIARQKGPDLLVEAMAPLLRAGWKLCICGPVNEPELHARVQELARPLGDRVFVGQLPRPLHVALMKAADVVVLPSRGETVGGVVFEGMLAGALTIVSDAVEAAKDDYLQHGHNGLLFPSEDVGALRAALARAMSEDTRTMRERARAMVEERFTWDASVDRLLALYGEALERHRGC